MGSRSAAVTLALGPIGFAVAFGILDLAELTKQQIEIAGLRADFFEATGLAEAGIVNYVDHSFTKHLGPGCDRYLSFSTAWVCAQDPPARNALQWGERERRWAQRRPSAEALRVGGGSQPGWPRRRSARAATLAALPSATIWRKELILRKLPAINNRATKMLWAAMPRTRPRPGDASDSWAVSFR